VTETEYARLLRRHRREARIWLSRQFDRMWIRYGLSPGPEGRPQWSREGWLRLPDPSDSTGGQA
jgi:hypothetical protein